MKKIIVSLVSAILLVGFLPLHAQTFSDLGSERILNYHSDIGVLPDGSMTVTENIKVVATNNTIKHGIYRDFPTRYKDEKGYSYVVNFTVTEVERDGVSEQYSTKDISNGVRVYIGDSNVVLSPGVYDYKISYITNRQLGYFADHDELYWNVTGNGWDYSIEQASATVSLPEGVPIGDVTTYGYSGVFGSKEGSYAVKKTTNSVEFQATRALQPKEGLTIVVGWPKGFVHEPTAGEKRELLLRDNVGLAVSFVSLIGLFLYYFIIWWKVGRDPKRGTIIPQYEPPQDLSPSGISYQSEMGYSKTALTVAILSMAVKGSLIISESAGPFGFGKIYTLTKTDKTVELSADEQAVANAVFKGSEVYKVGQGDYLRMQDAGVSLKAVLERTLKSLFVKNTKISVVGISLALSVLGVCILTVGLTFGNSEVLVFLVLWLAMWTLGTVAFVKQTIESFSSNRTLKSLAQIFLTLPCIAAEIFVFSIILLKSSYVFAILVALVISVNVVFLTILPRRTIEGRRLQDEVEGFKWFLSVTEKDRMNFHNPPDKTPQLFEKYLPYALALGVEQKWSLQFASVFEALAQSGGPVYAPVWYVGSAFNTASIGSFVSDLGGSFGNAISPGSSGGGGGGSSGGGGGGGGGGGW